MIAPNVDCSPTSNTSFDPIPIVISASDTGGSGVNNIRYRFTNSTAKPATFSSTVNGTTTNITLDEDGTWYLHMEVTDNAGNTYYRYRGPFTYNGLKITGVSIQGYINHWRGQVDAFGKQLTNEPHRFLSLEKVRVTVNTSGYADKIVIRFSPQLEAMTYTDPNGNVYNYSDKTGYNVYFPTNTTFNLNATQNTSTLNWDYILPLAPSTKSWNNQVLSVPYTLTVTAYKGATSVTTTISDLQITGNLYDIIHVQPG